MNNQIQTSSNNNDAYIEEDIIVIGAGIAGLTVVTSLGLVGLVHYG